jgi:hypothetical protein
MKTIDAILGSPPDRDGLTVEFYHHNGDQFAELLRRVGRLILEVFSLPGSPAVSIDAQEFAEALSRAMTELGP